MICRYSAPRHGAFGGGKFANYSFEFYDSTLNTDGKQTRVDAWLALESRHLSFFLRKGGLMEITISLFAQDYECLLNHVSAESAADHTLRTAAISSHAGPDALYQSYDIICDERQAEELRKTAQQHCPDVLPKIDDAIKKALPKR
jgi:hypothetical protein